MFFCRAAVVLGLIGVTGQQAAAQQVVQLPTFSFFTVSTSLSIPDSGGAYQGGFNRARYGQNGAGFQNRATAHGLQTAHSGVSATIIDHHEFDTAQTQVGRGIASPAPNKAAARSSAERVPGSLADAQRLRDAETAAKADEAKRLLEQARAAETAGKLGVARIFYSNAAKRADGVLRDDALSGLLRLQAAKPAAKP